MGFETVAIPPRCWMFLLPVLWASASCACCRAQECPPAPAGKNGIQKGVRPLDFRGSDPFLNPVFSCPAEPCCHDVVFVANGAGDFRKASENIAQTAAEDHLPLDTVTFCWSHGYCRILSDQLDHAHARAQGMRLAQLAVAHRRACPHG